LFLPVLCCLLAATPGHESASVDLERNRQLLQKWKTDPEHYARLRSDLEAFWALPEEKRQRLRRLDRDLHQLDAKAQKELWTVVERYRLWLDRLAEEDRRQIEDAGDTSERLRLIKEIRDRQWIERLPRTVREELRNTPADGWAMRVAQLREQERRQRKLWQRPLGAGPGPRGAKQPSRLHDFPKEVQEFVEKHLLPRLTADEELHYRRSEGQWPAFPLLLIHLSERYPVLPPLPAPQRPITHYEDLSEQARRIAGPKTFWERRSEEWKKLQLVEGKWPQWAETMVTLLTDEQRKTMPPLGASRPREFPIAVQTFLETTLRIKVKGAEFRKLRETEGKWPDYPRRLLDLAHKHHLQVPGMSLPGPAELWEDARKK